MINISHTGDGSTESKQRVDDARRQASTNGKRVAVIFGADWCPDYRALEAALESPYVAPFVDPAYELVRLDVGQRDRHLGLMDEYGMDVHRGIPAVAILEDDGTLVAAQTEGEFGSARALPVVEIAEFFRRHMPPGKTRGS